MKPNFPPAFMKRLEYFRVGVPQIKTHPNPAKETGLGFHRAARITAAKWIGLLKGPAAIWCS